MMQWVTYVSLGLVLIVSTAHGEEDAIVANRKYAYRVDSYKLKLNCYINVVLIFCDSTLFLSAVSSNEAKITRSKGRLDNVDCRFKFRIFQPLCTRRVPVPGRHVCFTGCCV
jgi:hypothetical protein